ncbi:hypothetical protein BC938DRAFT_477214 [Jimgerdemannia flammicorona]|uniref:Homeobox domain-containing protein n=2 Tax=Jimgerdemannia flammicorona TaxID=994334 RepID=A0A433QPM9_9FUNG|nr:hypothetical protein BC938DRAFT_477214 [Jimgerdemannia flammicorona]
MSLPTTTTPRRRHRITPKQAEMLEAYFVEDHAPNINRRVVISEQLGLSLKYVYYCWAEVAVDHERRFQHRRSKIKAEQGLKQEPDLVKPEVMGPRVLLPSATESAPKPYPRGFAIRSETSAAAAAVVAAYQPTRAIRPILLPQPRNTRPRSSPFFADDQLRDPFLSKYPHSYHHPHASSDTYGPRLPELRSRPPSVAPDVRVGWGMPVPSLPASSDSGSDSKERLPPLECMIPSVARTPYSFTSPYQTPPFPFPSSPSSYLVPSSTASSSSFPIRNQRRRNSIVIKPYPVRPLIPYFYYHPTIGLLCPPSATKKINEVKIEKDGR